jgi:hypothetical protein
MLESRPQGGQDQPAVVADGQVVVSDEESRPARDAAPTTVSGGSTWRRLGGDSRQRMTSPVLLACFIRRTQEIPCAAASADGGRDVQSTT